MKKNKIEKFLEDLPVETDIIKQLNNAIDSGEIGEEHFENRTLPVKFGTYKVVFDDIQYGDSADKGTVVFHLESYNTYAAYKYNVDSYAGDDYSDAVFVKVTPNNVDFFCYIKNIYEQFKIFKL